MSFSSIKIAVRKIMAKTPLISHVYLNTGLFLLFRRIILLSFPNKRTALSKKYLKGEGIEIGAFHNPLVVPFRAKVRYVDRLSVQDLIANYPAIRDFPLAKVTIVDDGEKLNTIPSESQDFIIVNHILEHCENPIGTIEIFLNRLKKDGILYLTIPDKRFTLDIKRLVTPLEHLIKDYKDGPSGSRREHCREYAEIIEGKRGEELEKQVELIMNNHYYSMHFHVWTDKELSELFAYLQKELHWKFEVMESAFNHIENIFIIKKI